MSWRGWTRSPEPYKGESLHVGPLRGRKQISLYTVDYSEGAEMHVHAYFRSEEEAERFMGILERLLRVRP